MRLRFGVAMPPKGGRTAIVGAEVRERRGAGGKLEHEYLVGSVDRVQPFTVGAARARVEELGHAFLDLRPCVLVDVGSPQGLALRQALREGWPKELHKPHPYLGTGDRVGLFAAFLQAYSTERVKFMPRLPHRAELEKALVLYLGGGVATTGAELSSEDEALVVALGLAMFWPRHGARAAKAGAPAVASDDTKEGT